VTTSTSCAVPASAVKFSCKNGYTNFCTSVYVVGNIPKLGLWNPAEAVKLEPNGPYPVWTGNLNGLPCGQPIEWKCIKRLEGNSSVVVEWEPGANNTFTKSCSGDTAAAQEGDFKP